MSQEGRCLRKKDGEINKGWKERSLLVVYEQNWWYSTSEHYIL